MKKIAVIFLVLSFTIFGTISPQELGFGAKAGLNLAKFSGSDADLMETSPKFKLGTTIGGFVTYPLSDKLVIRPEVLFTQKGAKYKESEDGIDAKWKFKMNWLEIPVLAVYEVANNINVFAGPFLELYLNGESVIKVEGGGESYDADEKIEGDEVNSLGLGLIFGGGYGLTDNIDVEARFSLGLTSIDKDITMKNSGIQVYVNYYLKR